LRSIRPVRGSSIGVSSTPSPALQTSQGYLFSVFCVCCLFVVVQCVSASLSASPRETVLPHLRQDNLPSSSTTKCSPSGNVIGSIAGLPGLGRCWAVVYGCGHPHKHPPFGPCLFFISSTSLSISSGSSSSLSGTSSISFFSDFFGLYSVFSSSSSGFRGMSTDTVMGLGVSTGSTDTVVGGGGGGLPGAGR
jgi:hypothetical protein